MPLPGRTTTIRSARNRRCNRQALLSGRGSGQIRRGWLDEQLCHGQSCEAAAWATGSAAAEASRQRGRLYCDVALAARQDFVVADNKPFPSPARRRFSRPAGREAFMSTSSAPLETLPFFQILRGYSANQAFGTRGGSRGDARPVGDDHARRFWWNAHARLRHCRLERWRSSPACLCSASRIATRSVDLLARTAPTAVSPADFTWASSLQCAGDHEHTSRVPNLGHASAASSHAGTSAPFSISTVGRAGAHGEGRRRKSLCRRPEPPHLQQSSAST